MTEAAANRPGAAATGGLSRLSRTFSVLPRRAWAYWLATVTPVTVGVPIALAHLHGLEWTRFALLTAAATVAQLMSVRVSARRTFHPAIVFVVAAALLLPPEALVVMCVIQHVPEWIKQRYAWYVQPFNIANYVLATLAAWGAAQLVGPLIASSGQSQAVAGVAAAAAFVVVNRLLLSPMLRLSRGLTIRQTHLLAADDVALELVLALMAIPVVALTDESALLSILALAPLVLIHFTQRATTFLQEASDTISEQNESLEAANKALIERSTAALEALSATVDARDTYTAGHSKRVRDYAVAIGEQLGLSGEELESLSQAALLHDIGKIGVPDSVLLKEGPLTPLEWLAMRSHPEAGARIIERLGFLDDVVPVIRHHHERLDGQGYPDGVAGTEIPLGARIVHVADALDAMTTRRVYRDARTVAEAFAEIEACVGNDFCAECVVALERALVARGELVERHGMRVVA